MVYFMIYYQNGGLYASAYGADDRPKPNETRVESSGLGSCFQVYSCDSGWRLSKPGCRSPHSWTTLGIQSPISVPQLLQRHIFLYMNAELSWLMWAYEQEVSNSAILLTSFLKCNVFKVNLQ